MNKLGDKQPESKCALVFGQMNEPPGARARVALTGLTLAEYFRDVEGQDVLFFVDNIFRFTQANSEVSALLGRIPSAVGYQVRCLPVVLPYTTFTHHHSPRWQRIWASCRSASPPPRKAPSRRCRQSTCPPMI